MYPLNGDVVEVAVIAEHDGTEDVVNVHHYQVSGSTYTTEADFITDLKSLVVALITVYKGMASVLTVYKRFRAQIITQTGAGVMVELDSEIPGTATGTAMPPGVAALCVLRTSAKNGNLKKYVGVPATVMLDTDGSWASFVQTLGATAIAFLLAPQTKTYGTFTFGNWRKETSTWYTPTSGYFNLEPAYQRRRRRGRGS